MALTTRDPLGPSDTAEHEGILAVLRRGVYPSVTDQDGGTLRIACALHTADIASMTIVVDFSVADFSALAGPSVRCTVLVRVEPGHNSPRAVALVHVGDAPPLPPVYAAIDGPPTRATADRAMMRALHAGAMAAARHVRDRW